MIVDCDSCAVRDLACKDCVVTFLLDGPARHDVGECEQEALGVLADSGLVPRLRLVPLGLPSVVATGLPPGRAVG